MILRKVYSFLLIITLAFLCNTNGFSQNFNDALRLSEPGFGFGAKAQAMGGAFVGLSDDYSASYYNPAGLFQLRNLEFTGSFDYHKFNNSSVFILKNNDFNQNKTNLSNFGIVFPFPTVRGSLVFSLGYNVIKNFNSGLQFSGYNQNSSMIQSLLGRDDIAYRLYLTDTTGKTSPINGKVLQNGLISSEGILDSWNLSGAIEISKGLSVGLSMNILGGDFVRNREYSETDINKSYENIKTDPTDNRTRGFQRFEFMENLAWELSGFGIKIGTMYKIKDFGRIGFAVKLPEVYTIKEKYLVDANAQFITGFNPDNTIDDELEYDITTPMEISLGASYTKFGLTLAADGHLIDYTQMKFSNLSNSIQTKRNNEIKTLMRAVFNYNFGLEYEFRPADQLELKLRAGYATLMSPFKDDDSSYDKKIITAGLGVVFDNSIGIDLAFVRSKWDTFGDNYSSFVSRTYQTITNTDFVFALNYWF